MVESYLREQTSHYRYKRLVLQTWLWIIFPRKEVKTLSVSRSEVSKNLLLKKTFDLSTPDGICRNILLYLDVSPERVWIKNLERRTEKIKKNMNRKTSKLVYKDFYVYVIIIHLCVNGFKKDEYFFYSTLFYST